MSRYITLNVNHIFSNDKDKLVICTQPYKLLLKNNMLNISRHTAPLHDQLNYATRDIFIFNNATQFYELICFWARGLSFISTFEE